MKKTNKKAFSLVELLVVIAIIGILATLAVISLQGARKGARDAKRIANIKQIQTALELYFNDQGQYPSSLNFGQGKIESPSTVYMENLPLAPSPSDGTCANDNTYQYSVTGEDNGSYQISFCLGSPTGQLSSGPHCANPGGIVPGYCGDNSFNCGDSVSYQGQSYATIQIGSQCWFKENLNVGTMVDGVVDQSDNSLIEKYCYNNLESNCDTYGALYQWGEAMNYTTSTLQGICPDGWHIPSDDEWTELTRYVINNPSCDPNSGCPPAGAKLKDDINSGFTALAAGRRMDYGVFHRLGVSAFFWSSSESYLGKSWYRYLYSGEDGVYRYNEPQSYGYSLRCLRTE